MGKMIINNKSGLGDDIALTLVVDCIKNGRISNDVKQYCYASLYSVEGKKYALYSDLNKASDSFTLVDCI